MWWVEINGGGDEKERSLNLFGKLLLLEEKEKWFPIINIHGISADMYR